VAIVLEVLEHDVKGQYMHYYVPDQLKSIKDIYSAYLPLGGHY